MEKQKKQLIIMAAVLVLLVLAYFGAKVISENQDNEDSEQTESYTVTDIDTDNVTAFSYYVEGALLEFVKSGDEWKYSGDETIDLDESVVNTLLNRTCGLVSDTCITDYDDISTYGLDEPVNTISITTADKTVVILIGDENEFDGGYYCMLENGDSVYMTTSTVVSAYEATVEDLTVEEEETEDTEDSTDTEAATDSEETESTEAVTE